MAYEELLSSMFGGGGGGAGGGALGGGGSASSGVGAGGFEDLIGSIAGFTFGHAKSTGSGKAFMKGLAFQEHAFRETLSQQKRTIEQFLGLAPQLAQSAQKTAMANPAYAALQSTIVQDLRNKGADPALTAAFESSVRQQLASRGVLMSPHTAIGQSLSVLQFNEALRQKSIQNAGQFLGIRSPTQIGISDLSGAQVQPGAFMGGAFGFGESIFGANLAQSNATRQNYFNATNLAARSVSKVISDPSSFFQPNRPQQVGGG